MYNSISHIFIFFNRYFFFSLSSVLSANAVYIISYYKNTDQSSGNFGCQYDSNVSDYDTNASRFVEMLQMSILMHLYLVRLLILYGGSVVNLSEGSIEIGPV